MFVSWNDVVFGIKIETELDYVVTRLDLSCLQNWWSKVDPKPRAAMSVRRLAIVRSPRRVLLLALLLLMLRTLYVTVKHENIPSLSSSKPAINQNPNISEVFGNQGEQPPGEQVCVPPELLLWHPALAPYFKDVPPLQCDKVTLRLDFFLYLILPKLSKLLSSSRTSVRVKLGLFNAKIRNENRRYIYRLIYQLNEQDFN